MTSLNLSGRFKDDADDAVLVAAIAKFMGSLKEVSERYKTYFKLDSVYHCLLQTLTLDLCVVQLNLSSNRRNAVAAEKLGRVIAASLSLTSINLKDNNLRTAGCIAIAKGIRSNKGSLQFIE